MSDALKAQDLVYIKKLNRNGYVVEVLAKGKVKVTLGAMTITVPISSVTKIEIDTEPVLRETSRRSFNVVPATPGNKHYTESEEIDLHGLNVEQAIHALETKINRALMSNLGRIKVIHGFGSGKVMYAVHSYLNQSSLVVSFRVDDFNPGQTYVYF